MGAALVLFLLWMAATWLLEGRPRTLLRPDAVVDRLIYAAVANLLIGTLCTAIVLAIAVRSGTGSLDDAGYGASSPSFSWLALGAAAGILAFAARGAPSWDPIVIANVFAQVLPVSIAEALVCWSLIGGLLRPALGAPQWRAGAVAGIVASAFFGLYHFGHSPPFDSVIMVAFLSAVGLLTSVVFLVSRDIYATIIFHNFLATIGVADSLATSGQLHRMASPQGPLLALAALALLLLIALDVLLIRRVGRDRD
ncbi:MAG: CPBP family intramembrane metalloprotease [Alphaproteobacteria bacterium]|nr:CPBP family intramembrane metalloprotease [Alphaproteobacteria bacterium]MCW5740460.1 CPBP family intramembrane metalloprotease [Alphaproteobacteria bacterium]